MTTTTTTHHTQLLALLILALLAITLIPRAITTLSNLVQQPARKVEKLKVRL